MEACLKHLQGFDKSLCDLADSNKDSHRRIDKRAKETEDLKKRVLELESQNILLGAKVRDSAMVSLIPSLSSFRSTLYPTRFSKCWGNGGNPNRLRFRRRRTRERERR